MNIEDMPINVVFRNGRGRRVSLLPKGSPERRIAERASKMREDGLTMRQVSKETGLSPSTLRRMLTRLALTVEIEQGKHDQEIARYLPGARGRKPAHPVPVGAVPAVAMLRQRRAG